MSVKNLCVFSGRVGQDPEMRYLPDGTAMVTFGLASRRSWPAKEKDSDGNTIWNEETTWVDCVAFGSIAERLLSRVQQGTQLMVQTEYTKRKAQNDAGEERTYHNFKINDFQTGVKAIERDEDGAQTGSGAPAGEPAPQYQTAEPEDIPF